VPGLILRLLVLQVVAWAVSRLSLRRSYLHLESTARGVRQKELPSL